METKQKKQIALGIQGWICEKEVQARLGLRTTTLWKLRTTGQLKWSRIGKTPFYSEASIIAYIEKNAVPVCK